MRSTGTTLTTFFAAFLVIAIAGGLFWANLNFVAQVPGGEDFIVPWKAMQNFMMQGVTPYGKLTSLNIQTAIYHNPLRAGQNPYPVNIPLHLLIFYLPLSWIGNFSIARAIWLSLLEAGVFGVVFSSLRLLRWNPGWIFLLFILLFCSFWQPSVVMVVTATPVILQALLICVALLSLELQFDELAGALAVLSLMNIEATGLAFVVLVVWVFSTRRWRVLGGVLMTLVVLLALSFLLQPAWLYAFHLQSV